MPLLERIEPPHVLSHQHFERALRRVHTYPLNTDPTMGESSNLNKVSC